MRLRALSKLNKQKRNQKSAGKMREEQIILWIRDFKSLSFLGHSKPKIILRNNL